MSRNLNARSVKPKLEQLEDRLQPSVLLGSNAVGTLVNQVNTVLTDMQHAQNNLTTDFNSAVTALGNNPNGDNVRQFAHPFGKAVADYQQILNDQATIHLMVNTDNTFLQQVALAEAMSGDPTDLLILTFFRGSNFDPTTQLTNVQNQADQIRQDTTLQNEVNHIFDLRNPADPGFNATRDQISIAAEVNTPSFGQ
jgi:hypothetical protein